MGKNKKLCRSEDGFIQLVRCEVNSDHTIHTDTPVSKKETVEYWKKRYRQVEEEKDAEIDRLRRKIKLLENDIKTLETINAELLDSNYDGPSTSYSGPTLEDPQFDSGLGLSIEPGKDPKLYRLSEPDEELVPKREFKGADFKIQPGRGFQLGLHWK